VTADSIGCTVRPPDFKSTGYHIIVPTLNERENVDAADWDILELLALGAR